MKTDDFSEILSMPDSPNRSVLISILSADPELLESARSEGYLVGKADSRREFRRSVSSVGDDSDDLPVHTRSMNTVTRQELDAKLEAIEARMDARVVSIEGKIDIFLAEQRERDKRLDERLEQGCRESDQRFQAVIRDIDRLGSLKANIWGAMATTIIILVAIGALGLTAFQAGAVKSMPATEKGQRPSAPLQNQQAPAPALPASDIPSE